jgi:hypothetical protein
MGGGDGDGQEVLIYQGYTQRDELGVADSKSFGKSLQVLLTLVLTG